MGCDAMPLELPDRLIVSVSGFRGRVGDPLTPELMTGIAAAFGSYLRATEGPGRVLLGRDSRTSGSMYAQGVAAGLRSTGCDVVDLGIVPTPTLMLAVETSDALGGIGVTASHNPAEWNALKFAGPDGNFLDRGRMEAFLDHLRNDEPTRAAWDRLGEFACDDGAIARHLEAIGRLPQIDGDALRARNFVVALDCVRGAGGLIMPELLESLGCDVRMIHGEPDGRFPRDPEPTAAHLRELGDLVRETGADIGFAVDPDVDRLSLVDDTGRAMGEDLTLALASAAVLRRTPGPVVTNLSTSRVVEDVAASFGMELVRAPVGEINVARRMQEAGAVVGGEGNGGVILPALHLTRDAPVGAVLILQHLLDEGCSASEAAARWPAYRIVKEKVDFPREALPQGYEALGTQWPEADRNEEDGLRLAWGSDRSWVHVRPSGTEPIVRIIAEAPDEGAANRLVEESREALESVISG